LTKACIRISFTNSSLRRFGSAERRHDKTLIAWLVTVTFVVDNAVLPRTFECRLNEGTCLSQETQYLKIERGERVVLMVNGWVFMLLDVPVSHVHLFFKVLIAVS
jgi:hypothetical protein